MTDQMNGPGELYPQSINRQTYERSTIFDSPIARLSIAGALSVSSLLGCYGLAQADGSSTRVGHDALQTEPIEVQVKSLDDNNHPVPTPFGIIKIEKSCDGETTTTLYDKTIQLLGRCTIGSKVRLTEILPNDGPFGDSNHNIWQNIYSPHQLTISDKPVKTSFVNYESTLDTDGIPDEGGYYYYVSGQYFSQAVGATADIEQSDPTVINDYDHSVAEIAVSFGGSRDQVVETGWIVDRGQFGDNLPHLFATDWVNGKLIGFYNNGFIEVPNPDNITPGEAVTVGDIGDYKIVYSSYEWAVYYDGNEIGYFPESLWGGNFTQASEEQAFGEIYSISANNPCDQMGDGIAGSENGSTTIRNYDLINTDGNAYIPKGGVDILVPQPGLYNVGNDSLLNGFNFGGPGGSSCNG